MFKLLKHEEEHIKVRGTNFIWFGDGDDGGQTRPTSTRRALTYITISLVQESTHLPGTRVFFLSFSPF